MKRTTRFAFAMLAGSTATLAFTPSAALASAPDKSKMSASGAAAPKMEADAKKVWDRAIESTYGKLAKDHESLKNIKAEGTLSIPAQGMDAAFSAVTIPGRGVMESINLPGMGEFQQGAIDGTAWSFNAMMGPRILEGIEMEQTLDKADIFGDLDWSERYDSITYKGEETITLNDGTELKVQVLELDPKLSEEPTTRYYDAKTGLMVKETSVMVAPQAQIPTTTYMSNYKDVGGMKMAHTTTVIVGPNEMTITLDKVTVNNEDLTAEAITPPEAVKELMDDEG